MDRMSPLGAVLTFMLFAAALSSCSDDARGGDDDGGGGDADTDSDSDSDTSTDGCSEAAKKIYGIGRNGTLFSFLPPDKKFVAIGKVSCQGAGSPYSMSVARDGTAYMLFYDGASTCRGLYKVSTADASCLGKTAFACGDQGFGLFGMGFATDGPDTKAETLFVGKTVAPYRLGSIDLSTFKINPIGNITAAPEMTGNGAGELWAFFAWVTPPKVAQFDKTTGAESNVVQLSQIPSNGSFAFAFWGGDFYLFDAPAGDTTVWKLSGGQAGKYMQNTGAEIIGAGVSTCAPLVPE
ncbi:MAG: hypothetical protein PHU25_18050 [Deltaproteobacteria bacterium]|nr:hypothetical protein [Deltaproteobacteria bacterium]